LETYFLDTCAIIEIIQGNNRYQKYLDKDIILSKFNIIELSFYFLKENSNKEFMKEKIKYFNQYIINDEEITLETIEEANEFKLKHLKEKLSYFDCLGYIISKNKGIKFVTQDGQFKNKDKNVVEFIEKK